MLNWRLAGPLCACIALTACSTPYSLSLEDFDEAGRQAAAAIEISDPQVYTRENLTNDRRKEVVWLNGLLQRRGTQHFVPQLRGDLREITAFTGSFRAAVDPALGAAAGRAAERAEIEQHIALANPRTQLAETRERRTIAESRATAVAAGETAEGAPPTVPATSIGEATVPALAEPSDIRGRLDGLDKKLGDLLSKQADVTGTDIPATPSERFRDERAYREEIRAAIAETNLDDLHDTGGNALYRLQFRATVPPGERKGQFGVAYLRIDLPAPSSTDLERLYFAWPGHVTLQLNLPLTGGTMANWRHETPGASGDLYQIAYPPLPGTEASQDCGPAVPGYRALDGCLLIRLALMPRFGVGVQELIDTVASAQAFAAELRRLALGAEPIYDGLTPAWILQKSGAGECATALDESWVRAWFSRATLRRSGKVVVREAQRLQRFPPSLASSVRALQTAIPRLARSAGPALRSLSGDLNRISIYTRGTLQPLADAFPNCPDFDEDVFRADLGRDVPPGFLRPPVGAERIESDKTCEPSGRDRSYVYAAKPAELAQGVSSAASAGNALELAFALSATMPQSGLNAEAGAGLMRAAIGRMEAPERAPIVVAYAAAEPPSEENGRDDRRSTVGWVFGPPLAPEPENDTLQRPQGVINHQVFADISAPGWSPWLNLDVETAWAAHRHQGGHGPSNAMEPKSSRRVRVDLPQNRAGLERLTAAIARNVWGLQPATTQIFDVEPKRVHVCPGRAVRFLVSGFDIRCNATVFTDGTEAGAGTVRVLPDMAGITAQFDPSKVPLVAGEAEPSVLTIWTRNGADRFEGPRLLHPASPNTCGKGHEEQGGGA